MTDEQINAAIAEACGWKLQGSPEHQKATIGWEFGYQFVIMPTGEVISRNSIPNYCTDLNAMHEAEKLVTSDWNLTYSNQLARITDAHYSDDPCFFCATARQRAEAFLRTLGKWQPTTEESSVYLS